MQNDLISRKSLMAHFATSQALVNDRDVLYCNGVMDVISREPTVDAVPVVHGLWVRDDLGNAYCSKCHERLPYIHCYSEEPCSDYDAEWDAEIPETRYCPNCGARMDGGAENV